MKKIILLTLIAWMTLHVCAQTYFSKRFFYEDYNTWDAATQILENDSNYIIVGTTGDVNNFFWHRLGFLTIDKLGNKLLSQSLGDTIYEYSFQYSGAFRKSGDNGYIGVGVRRKYTEDWVHDAGTIFKFNRFLDTIWTNSNTIDKELPMDTSYIFNHFFELGDKSLIIIGGIVVSGTQGTAILVKTDSLGNEQWRQYYPIWPHSKGINVIQTPDGGFALSCFTWSFQSGLSDNYLIKTDSLGNKQWWRKIGGPFSDGAMYIVNSPDSTVIGAYSYCDSIAEPSSDNFNRDAVIKYDLDGNLIWEKIYGESSWNKRLKSANITNDGSVIITGTKPEIWGTPLRQGFLFKVNNDGDSIWYRQYHKLHEPFSYNYLYGVTPTSDGGYIAVGDVLPAEPDTGNQDVWVIKVDSLGCESWDNCWVGVKEHIALREAGQLKIFPNPATYTINIFVPKESEEETHLLLIYDLYGRKVEETEVPPGTTTKQLSVSGWSSGLYTAIASRKGKITGRGKFVVR